MIISGLGECKLIYQDKTYESLNELQVAILESRLADKDDIAYSDIDDPNYQVIKDAQ